MVMTIEPGIYIPEGSDWAARGRAELRDGVDREGRPAARGRQVGEGREGVEVAVRDQTDVAEVGSQAQAVGGVRRRCRPDGGDAVLERGHVGCGPPHGEADGRQVNLVADHDRLGAVGRGDPGGHERCRVDGVTSLRQAGDEADSHATRVEGVGARRSCARTGPWGRPAGGRRGRRSCRAGSWGRWRPSR